ncbi:MAG: ABC transporter substrate-binding protein, partial [Tissierellia bacterium]|nr:ABC transporter substrate-binding protein [Tissierellia bacterium]
MKKKFSTLISVLLVLTMIITACSSGTDAPAEEETIKIGWIGSLTGDQAVWGTCESNMVK